MGLDSKITYKEPPLKQADKSTYDGVDFKPWYLMDEAGQWPSAFLNSNWRSAKPKISKPTKSWKK